MSRYGTISEWMEEIGITDKALADHIYKGLNATKLQACDVYVSKEGKEFKINRQSNDFIEVDDWDVRHKYLTTLLKLKGKLQPEVVFNDNSKHAHQIYLWKDQESAVCKTGTAEDNNRLLSPGIPKADS
jgi:hypothetical protein